MWPSAKSSLESDAFFALGTPDRLVCHGMSLSQQDVCSQQIYGTQCHSSKSPQLGGVGSYSTVTDFAKLRGWSTSVPFSTAT